MKKIITSYCPVEYMVTLYKLTNLDERDQLEVQLCDKIDNEDFYIFYDFNAATEFGEAMIESGSKYNYAVVDLSIFNNDEDWRCIDSVCVCELFDEKLIKKESK